MMHYLFGRELDLHYEALFVWRGDNGPFLRGMDLYFVILFNWKRAGFM